MSCVRRAGVEDVATVAPLFAAYRMFYGKSEDVAAAESFLRERLQRGESMLLLAEDETRALGFVQLYPLFSSVRLAPSWLLNDLFVAASARRRGVARALLQAAADYARGTDAAYIELETGRDNHAAQALYRSLGWQQATELRFHLPLGDG